VTIIVGIDSICYTRTLRAGSLDVAGLLDRAAAIGAQAIQMDPLWPEQGLDLSETALARLRGLLDERGLTVVIKGNSGGRGSLAQPPADVEEDMSLFRAKVKAAARLNAPVVRIVTRAYPYPTRHTTPPVNTPREQVINRVIANLKTLAAAAEHEGVRLAVENHGDLRIGELERILAEVDSAALGVQYDLVEQVAIFEDPRRAAERLLPRAITVHWHDAYPRPGGAGFHVVVCPPGEGLIDLDGIGQMIAAQPGDIYLFVAYQAETMDDEDRLARAYMSDLPSRISLPDPLGQP
jgi:sugar phosphate isomerase/epimerase